MPPFDVMDRMDKVMHVLVKLVTSRSTAPWR
jgi:hypothetical protein